MNYSENMNNYMERRFRKIILLPLLEQSRKGKRWADILLEFKWGQHGDYIAGYDDGEGPKEYHV